MESVNVWWGRLVLGKDGEQERIILERKKRDFQIWTRTWIQYRPVERPYFGHFYLSRQMLFILDPVNTLFFFPLAFSVDLSCFFQQSFVKPSKHEYFTLFIFCLSELHNKQSNFTSLFLHVPLRETMFMYPFPCICLSHIGRLSKTKADVFSTTRHALFYYLSILNVHLCPGWAHSIYC